jgi:hypothetical protein
MHGFATGLGFGRQRGYDGIEQRHNAEFGVRAAAAAVPKRVFGLDAVCRGFTPSSYPQSGQKKEDADRDFVRPARE